MFEDKYNQKLTRFTTLISIRRPEYVTDNKETVTKKGHFKNVYNENFQENYFIISFSHETRVCYGQ